MSLDTGVESKGTGDLVCLGAELIVQLIDSMWDWKGICKVFSLNNKMNLFI